ncbi:hypothetical protein CBS76997_8081 [Aspergillus niger]|nr:hypothetical protein CBS13152_3543 [Aspergillus niger]KAI3039112.1 hypothetical protein CBS76997_8081 [Aspergillus niger]KAI3066878.1 hypothetical protein CBS147353_7872 [Aspergillus niger]
MTVRDTVLLLVSVGRFSCFGYRASSLRGSGLQPLAVSPRESVLLLVCACAGSLREFRLVIFSIDRLNPPPPSASVSPPPSKFAMSQPEIADRFPSPLQKSEYDSLSVLRRNILSLKNANPPPARPSSSSPLTTSIKYHASPTRTNPGIEIAMRKVQEDRLEWEHDMIANLSDFLIEEVDHQLQDTRSKGSFWYMKSTYNDIPIRAVRHLRRDGPAAKVLPYKIDKARLAFKRVN